MNQIELAITSTGKQVVFGFVLWAEPLYRAILSKIMTEFDLFTLIPQWGCFFNGELLTSDGITALFVTITLCFFCVFAIWSLICFYSVRSRFVFYRDKLISPAVGDDLVSARRDMRVKASEKEKAEKWPELWNEFDETLVEVDGQLQNTVEASTFFNTSTLAGSLVGNRLLAAGPGIITGLGVLGTFLGLQLGLGSLTLEGNTAQMMQEIKGLVASASIAFTTSVWGVLLSLAFNFGEKFLERIARKGIHSLQTKIDELFPRFSASQVFVDIRDDGRESRRTLQGLAERIGDRMQEAVSSVSDSIQTSLEDSLKNVFTPAVDRLVTATEELGSRQASGSEEALKNLIETFTENVGKEGDNQRQALTSASEEVREALSALGSSMSSFFETLERQQTDMQDSQKAQRQQLEDALSKNMKQQDELNEHLRSSINEQHTTLLQEQQQREKLLEEKFDTAMKQQKELVEYVQTSVGGQVGAAESLLKQGESIGQATQRSNEQLGQVSTAMAEAVERLKDASSHMEGASGGLGSALTEAASRVQQSADVASRLMQENTRVHENVNNMLSVVDTIKKGMTESAELLDKTVGASREGYSEVSQNFQELQRNMAEQLDSLKEQMATLLSDYGDRVSDQTNKRMSEWNDQTRNYTSSMTDAIETISSFVEELELKLGK